MGKGGGLLAAACCCHTCVPVLCNSIAVLVPDVTQRQSGSHSRLSTGWVCSLRLWAMGLCHSVWQLCGCSRPLCGGARAQGTGRQGLSLAV